MLAEVSTAIEGLDVLFAVLVVILAVVLDRVAPIFVSWVTGSTLFLAALLTFAMLVRW